MIRVSLNSGRRHCRHGKTSGRELLQLHVASFLRHRMARAIPRGTKDADVLLVCRCRPDTAFAKFVNACCRKRRAKLGAERPSSTSQLVGTNLLVLTIPNKDTLVHTDDMSSRCSKVIVLLSIDIHRSIHVGEPLRGDYLVVFSWDLRRGLRILELVRGVSRELQVWKTHIVNHYLVGTNCRWSLKVLRSSASHVIVLIDAIAAYAKSAH